MGIFHVWPYKVELFHGDGALSGIKSHLAFDVRCARVIWAAVFLRTAAKIPGSRKVHIEICWMLT
jgi:hypothetical protein